MLTLRRLFTDEKRFKFDGPDEWCTWSRRGELVVQNKRQMGGGRVMVWGMIFANGNIWLEWLKGRQNCESYKQLLDKKALLMIRREMGNDFFLQQDNCSIHVSKFMKEWMVKVNMTTLEWPARSPDLTFNRKCLGNACATCLWWTLNNERGSTMGTNTRSQKTTNKKHVEMLLCICLISRKRDWSKLLRRKVILQTINSFSTMSEK